MLPMTKFGTAGLGLFVFGVAFGWVIFPMVLKSQVHKQVQLKQGSPTRALWSKFPFAIEFRVYLFNVTNPDEIAKGAKPIVKEVGPYFFEEWQEKTDLEDRESDDTIEFRIKNKWLFIPEKSAPLTGEEELTLPHIFILAMVMATVREKPTMVPVVNKAVNSIFKNPTSVFYKVRAMDMIFDGLPIDCTVTDFAGGAVCGMLKENPSGLMLDGEDKYKFSLLGAKNDTPSAQTLRVLRGVKNLNDVGVVVEWDGKPNISKWNDDFCDTFNGTDGTIFHPFFPETEDVVSFAPDICRSLSTTFEEHTSFDGVHTNRYTAFLGDSSTIPEQKCYCEAPDKCLKAGVMDLFKCVGAPLIASHPHLYLADKSYLKTVVGLSPSKEKHGIYLDFDPFTGSPLSARKRLQFNMMIQPVEKFKIMKTFPEAMLPLFWVEEAVDMPDWLMAQIKQGHTMVKIVNYVKWIMILVGMALCGYAGFIYYSMMQMAAKADISKSNNDLDKKISPVTIGNLHAAPTPPSVG